MSIWQHPGKDYYGQSAAVREFDKNFNESASSVNGAANATPLLLFQASIIC